MSIQNHNSPCINNCCLNEKDICMGCYRHIDEICQWRTLTNEQKQKVTAKIVSRKLGAVDLSF
ncbi:DUF1289 domain-containing protein [Thalassotalea eurytherma]|uniref:DUF1289 domain-containing protein n=1 Tax=Thalassotalea eurytherma TaxID=1144278 RepID=UPI0024E07DD2|nr:DUF1289 domain-containing protein [Thalassotalea eurytherma]